MERFYHIRPGAQDLGRTPAFIAATKPECGRARVRASPNAGKPPHSNQEAIVADLIQILRTLRIQRAAAQAEADRLDPAIEALAELGGKAAGRWGGPRHMSKAARKRIADAQRARWAKVGAEEGHQATKGTGYSTGGSRPRSGSPARHAESPHVGRHRQDDRRRTASRLGGVAGGKAGKAPK
jgi:hypothetical protein